MMNKTQQSGFYVIAMVILIMAASVIALIVSRSYFNNALINAESSTGSESFYLAVSGAERGIRQWSLNNLYTGEGPNALGNGTYTVQVFTTDFTGAALAANQRRIRGIGNVNNSQSTVDVIIQQGGTNLLTNGDFQIPGVCPGVPLQPSNWTITFNIGINPWQCTGVGNSVGIVDCKNIGSCGGGGNRTVNLQQTLSSTFVSTGAAYTINYNYNIDAFAGNQNIRVRFRLRRSTGGAWYNSSWQNYTATTGGFVSGTNTITPPAGQTIGFFQIQLVVRGNNSKRITIDNVELIPPGGGTITVLGWREMFP